MKLRLLQWIALTVLVLSSISCGLPQMLGRTVSNTVQKIGPLTRAATGMAL